MLKNNIFKILLIIIVIVSNIVLIGILINSVETNIKEIGENNDVIQEETTNDSEDIADKISQDINQSDKHINLTLEMILKIILGTIGIVLIILSSFILVRLKK